METGVIQPVDTTVAERDAPPAQLQRAAAAGDVSALSCALSCWLNSVQGLPKKALCKKATNDLCAALSAACQTDSSDCVGDLLHATSALTHSYDCAPAAVTAAAAAGSPRALAAALAAPELSRFMDSHGPAGPSMLAGAVSEALRSVLARRPDPSTSDEACLQLLLAGLTSASGPVAASRSALVPYAPALLAAAAASDMRGALQTLLVWLPEWGEALDVGAATAARSAGRHSLAIDIELLLSFKSTPSHAHANAIALPTSEGPASSAPQVWAGGADVSGADVSMASGDNRGGNEPPSFQYNVARKPKTPVVDTGASKRPPGQEEEDFEALDSPSCSISSGSSAGTGTGGAAAASNPDWGLPSPRGPSSGAAPPCLIAEANAPCATATASTEHRLRAALLVDAPGVAVAAARTAALSMAEVEGIISALLSAPPASLLQEAEAAVSDPDLAAGPTASQGLNAVAALPTHVAEFWAAFADGMPTSAI